MQFTRERVAARIGNKGYLDLVALFFSLGFKNIHDVPDSVWSQALVLYEQKMFRSAA